MSKFIERTNITSLFLSGYKLNLHCTEMLTTQKSAQSMDKTLSN